MSRITEAINKVHKALDDLGKSVRDAPPTIESVYGKPFEEMKWPINSLRNFMKSVRCFLVCWCVLRVRTRIAFNSSGMFSYCPRCQSTDRAGMVRDS